MARRHRYSDREKECVLTRRRARTKNVRRRIRLVVDEVRGVSRNVRGFAGPHGHFSTSKRHDAFTFQHSKRLFEIVTVRNGAAARRNLHVDEAEFLRRPHSAQRASVADSDRQAGLSRHVCLRLPCRSLRISYEPNRSMHRTEDLDRRSPSASRPSMRCGSIRKVISS